MILSDTREDKGKMIRQDGFVSKGMVAVINSMNLVGLRKTIIMNYYMRSVCCDLWKFLDKHQGQDIVQIEGEDEEEEVD